MEGHCNNLLLITPLQGMTLTSHRRHKIYLAATMGYGLGSDDPEEIAYYKKVKEEVSKDKKNRNMGIPRED